MLVFCLLRKIGVAISPPLPPDLTPLFLVVFERRDIDFPIMVAFLSRKTGLGKILVVDAIQSHGSIKNEI